MNSIKAHVAIVALMLVCSFLLGCSGAPEQAQVIHQAVAIEKADECHLCGMIISEFPGPKGELFHKTHSGAKKFCSTRDLFSFVLQPENKRQMSQVFVHDMSQVPWDSPDDKQFIDAKNAWYVHGSSQTGAMGATIASFGTEQNAQTFAQQFGGKVVRFDGINQDLLMAGM